MSNTPDVTTLALLNMIRLLAAELVAGEHRDDVAKLVDAMDRQLNATPLPRGVDVNDARAGIAHARELLRPYVAQIRDQAEAIRQRDPAEPAKAGTGRAINPQTSKYLQ